MKSMGYGNRTLAGSLLFLGSIVYFLGITAGGEKVLKSMDVINLSVVLWGVFMIAGASCLQRAFKSVLLSLLLAVSGICAFGVGLLVGDAYYAFAVVGYVTLGLAAIVSFKFAKAPLSYLSVVLCALSLIFIAIWAYSGMTSSSLLIDYSQLVWVAGFGGRIIEKSEKASS